MKRKGLLLVAALVLTLIPAGRVLAVTLEIPLNNDRAEFCIPGENGCPDTGDAYWHFVINPNNNESYYITFFLNLGDSSPYVTSEYVPELSDNVWVEVPDGYAANSLEKDGSYAIIDYTSDGSGSDPAKFTLSNVCMAQVPEPSTLLLLGSGLLGLGLMRRKNRI